MTHALLKTTGRALLAAALLAGPALAEDDADWRPLLDCRLQSSCEGQGSACTPEESWYIVRYEAENEAYSLFDANNMDSREITLSRHARVLVFDGVIETEEPMASSSLYRLIVAENGDASFQYGFYIAFDEDDWRFFSGATSGTCMEVDG